MKELRSRLRIVDHGDARESAVLKGALARLTESPTARELMRHLAALRATVQISFELFVGSRIIAEPRGKTLLASAAQSAHEPRPRVELNRDVLKMDRAYQLSRIPAHLGHELLGHVLGRLKANLVGLGDVYQHYRHNETDAALIGWTIGAELGGELSGAEHEDMWLLLKKGMEAYHRSLQMRMPYYATTLSLREMARPVTALRTRLDRVRAKLRSGSDRERRELEEIAEELSGYIRYWSSAEGRAFVRKLSRSRASPFLREIERTVARRLRRLKALARGG